MASAPLNWLLKIGGDALNTTAQTLSAAVNELKGLFATINNIGDVDISTPADGQLMGYDGTASKWKNVNAPVINDATLTIQQNGTSKGTFSANASSNASVNIITDDWTEDVYAETSGSDVVVIFDDLDDSFGYALYGANNEDVVYTEVVKDIGTNTGIKLTYKLDGATAGTTQCRLRILR